MVTQGLRGTIPIWFLWKCSFSLHVGYSSGYTHTCTHTQTQEEHKYTFTITTQADHVQSSQNLKADTKDLACVIYVSHPSLSLTSLQDRGSWHRCLQTHNHTSALHTSSNCGRQRCQRDLWPHSSPVTFILAHCAAFDWTVLMSPDIREHKQAGLPAWWGG